MWRPMHTYKSMQLGHSPYPKNQNKNLKKTALGYKISCFRALLTCKRYELKRSIWQNLHEFTTRTYRVYGVVSNSIVPCHSSNLSSHKLFTNYWIYTSKFSLSSSFSSIFLPSSFLLLSYSLCISLSLSLLLSLCPSPGRFLALIAIHIENCAIHFGVLQ